MPVGRRQAHCDGILAFWQADFSEDLKRVDVPALVIHGDDDHIVPLAAAGQRTAKLLKDAKLEI